MKLIPPELREPDGQGALTGLVEQTALAAAVPFGGTNETRGKTCRGMPNTCLLAELIQPWPNWTVMQVCPSFFVQFCSSVLLFRRRIKTVSVPRLPLDSTKIQGRPYNVGYY